jgi:menaquinone-9 beta-reductase
MEDLARSSTSHHGNGDLHDLIVVGGGPGGASAAITAARSRRRVLLLERGRLPRQRVCGEFVSAESLGLLAALLKESPSALVTDAVRIPGTRLFVEGRTICVPVKPAGASIARFDLDAALWHAAEATAVDVRQQTTVEQVERNGRFLVRTSTGNFESRAVVVAAGRWSNLDPEEYRASAAGPRWLGIKGHFAEKSPPASVDLYFFEGGYCGVQAVQLAGDEQGRVNVCAMVRANVARTLPEVFEQHPQLRARSKTWSPLMDPVSTSPLIFHEPQPIQDGMFRVGDAAGFVDPFVGDGISLALRSGAAAADCLAPYFTGRLSLDEASSRYREIYERKLLPVFRNSSKLRRLLRLPRVLRIPIAYLLESAPTMTRHLVHMTR